jgi:hypothetical protein
MGCSSLNVFHYSDRIFEYAGINSLQNEAPRPSRIEESGAICVVDMTAAIWRY